MVKTDNTAFDPKAKVENINPGEKLLSRTGRHMIGLFFIYFQAFAALGIAFGFIFLFFADAIQSLGINSNIANISVSIFSLVAVVLVLAYLVLATKIYFENELIVTSDNVTHITQVGLFHRKVSEISMANVEDVTAHRRGILPTILNYGRVHIETAGEQNNYDFLYCPNPDAYGKIIQDARLEFIKTHGD